jgi:hypothetical protein
LTLRTGHDPLAVHQDQGELPLEGGNRAQLKVVSSHRKVVSGHLPDLPPELAAAPAPTPAATWAKPPYATLIRDLCGWQALRGEELATLLHKDLKYLRNKHLTEMVHTGELAFLFPESPNHALQAYKLSSINQEQNAIGQ